ncbi:MAG: hypothetical protein FWC95_01865 [Defluviitaleaceae bacterium]|nr:hypothetical protein [Defluviitaleaceae bacterium]
MYSAYIIRTKDDLFYSFYYSQENGICRRVMERGKWDTPMTVAVDAMPGFWVNLGNDGKIYVLYKDTNSKPMLAVGNKDGFRSEAVGSVDGMYIVASSRGRMFVENMPQVVSDDHLIMFTKDNSGLYCREMNYTDETESRAVHIGAGVFCFSALTSEDNIHYLYGLKGALGGGKVMYRRRHKSGLSAAVTICDNRALDDVWVFVVGRRVYAAFYAKHPARTMFLCHSDDNGQSFTKPEKYRRKICDLPIKAMYQQYTQYNEQTFATREIYVDSLNPWDIQILPDVYDDFYPGYIIQTPDVQKTTPQNLPVLTKAPLATPTPVIQPTQSWYGEDIPQAEKQRNKIEDLEHELTTKDRQLAILKQEIENQRAVIKRIFEGRKDI